MTLKTKAALTYVLPLLLTYVGAVAALSAGGRPEWTDLAAGIIPASALGVVSHLLQDLLPKSVKEFLVFFRVRERLPGHRAFTQVCVGDPRIPEAFLRTMCDETAGSGSAQNTKWYAQYRKVSKEPQVEHENARYLGWRDATATLVILAAFTLSLAVFSILSWVQVAYVSLACLVVSFLTGIAARNSANSLVRNVAAIEASGSAESPME